MEHKARSATADLPTPLQDNKVQQATQTGMGMLRQSSRKTNSHIRNTILESNFSKPPTRRYSVPSEHSKPIALIV